MKQRIFTTLTALVAIVMGMQAGVNIGNTEITADGTVSSTYIKSGSVSYNSASNTLTLNNATINTGSSIVAIKFTSDGTLVIIGTNSVTGDVALFLNACNVSIQLSDSQSGSATFVGGSGNCGIYVPSNSTLTINEGCTVTAQGGWGIAGYDGTLGETVVINSATVHATGTQASISDLQSFTMNGCEITSPAGAEFNTSEHAVCVGTTKVTSEVVIEPTHDGIPIDAEHFSNASFRNYIGSTSANYDRDRDGYLSDDELSKVTWMNVADKNITDLTGIQYFTAMTSLYCHNNPLGTLDLSGCTALKSLQCNGCQLTSLIVPQSITSIQCYNNRIDRAAMNALVESQPTVTSGVFMVKNANGTEQNVCTDVQVAAAQAKGWNVYYSNNQSYDGTIAINETNFPDENFRNYVSENIDTNGGGTLSEAEIDAVTEIRVTEKSITNLKGIELFCNVEKLICYTNQLTSLDVSNNTALTYLSCDGNQLTSLDVSNNTALMELYCRENQLTTLNLSNNAALTKVLCEDNKITDLLFNTNATELTRIVCFMNQIYGDAMTNLVESLPNVSSGEFKAVDITNSKEQNSITKADADIATAKGWTVQTDMDSDPFENGIAINKGNFPDDTFRSFVQSNYDTDSDGYLSETEIAAVDEMHVTNKGITDLRGIKNFTALIRLNCSGNNLTSLDVSGCTGLCYLTCYGNSIKRDAMERLVRSLSTINDGKGYFVVYAEVINDGNECTEKHVFGLEMKGWQAYYYDKTEQEWLPYAGISEASGGANGDTNGDGQVTIADVTKLVNIILGKE